MRMLRSRLGINKSLIMNYFFAHYRNTPEISDVRKTILVSLRIRGWITSPLIKNELLPKTQWRF
jgi:hypothetical protein